MGSVDRMHFVGSCQCLCSCNQNGLQNMEKRSHIITSYLTNKNFHIQYTVFTLAWFLKYAIYLLLLIFMYLNGGGDKNCDYFLRCFWKTRAFWQLILNWNIVPIISKGNLQQEFISKLLSIKDFSSG